MAQSKQEQLLQNNPTNSNKPMWLYFFSLWVFIVNSNHIQKIQASFLPLTIQTSWVPEFPYFSSSFISIFSKTKHIIVTEIKSTKFWPGKQKKKHEFKNLQEK